MRINVLTACVLVVLFSISGCESSSSVSTNGFDKICAIYTDVLNNPAHKEFTLSKKMNLIDDEIIKHVKDTDALQVYSAVKNADPSEKYKLFKESAEYALKRQWDCPVMIYLNDES